jgi:transposase
MGESYSSDLMKRVVRFVDAGHSRREAAQHFRVGPSFAVKLEARRR